MTKVNQTYFQGNPYWKIDIEPPLILQEISVFESESLWKWIFPLERLWQVNSSFSCLPLKGLWNHWHLYWVCISRTKPMSRTQQVLRKCLLNAGVKGQKQWLGKVVLTHLFVYLFIAYSFKCFEINSQMSVYFATFWRLLLQKKRKAKVLSHKLKEC